MAFVTHALEWFGKRLNMLEFANISLIAADKARGGSTIELSFADVFCVGELGPVTTRYLVSPLVSGDSTRDTVLGRGILGITFAWH